MQNKPRHDNPYQPPCFDDIPLLQPQPRDRRALPLAGVHALIVLQEMKSLHKVIAIVSGIIVVFGYVTIADESGISAPRIFVGLIFGVAIAVSMIRHPERISRNHLSFVVAPLLAILIGWTAMYESTRVIQTIIWALFFLASQVAFFVSASNALVAEPHHHSR